MKRQHENKKYCLKTQPAVLDGPPSGCQLLSDVANYGVLVDWKVGERGWACGRDVLVDLYLVDLDLTWSVFCY